MGEAASKARVRGGGSAAVAQAVVADADQQAILRYLSSMAGEGSGADKAARVLEKVALSQPELLSAHVAKLLTLMYAGRDRVAQAAAVALGELTQVVPAKVGKHLDTLRSHATACVGPAREGTFRVLIGLCKASVAYQRRVQDLIEDTLRSAAPKQLVQWTALALPVLKGEPYAEVRALIMARMPELPGDDAHALAEQLDDVIRSAR